MLNGYKTYLGAAIMGLGAALAYLGQPDIGRALEGLGVALGIVGIGHKIEKSG